MRSQALVLMLPASLATGGILLNGSFEAPQQSGPTRVSIGLLEEWQASGGFMLLEQGVNGVSNTAAHSGTQFVSMGHNGATGDTLSQSFATVAGQVYTVSFFTVSIQGVAAQSVIASVLDDASQATLASLRAEELAVADGWTEHRFSFTATGDATILSFVHDTGSGGANIALDTVSVVIPAPAALGVLATGLLARRRR